MCFLKSSIITSIFGKTLNEATDGVKKIRDETVGELENRLGLRCMSKQRYRKAIIHFAAGSALQNSSATFNLAQCYELGLGTRQNYEKVCYFAKFFLNPLCALVFDN